MIGILTSSKNFKVEGKFAKASATAFSSCGTCVMLKESKDPANP